MAELLYAGSSVQELNDSDISLRQPLHSGGGDSVEFYCSRPQFANTPHYIIFYAPWCGHCHNVVPTMKDLANTMLVGAVNSDVASDATQRVGVSGFPTIYFFKDASSSPMKYDGERSLEAFQRFNEEAVSSSNKGMPVPNSPEWNDMLRRALHTAVASVKGEITKPATFSPKSRKSRASRTPRTPRKIRGGKKRSKKNRKVSKNSRRNGERYIS